MIETDRLILRQPVPADAQTIAVGIGNWAVVRWLSAVPYPYTEQDALDWIASKEGGMDGAASLVVERKSEPGIIGGLGLSVRDESAGDPEIGYWFAEPFWGQGFASEAATALRDYGFIEMGYDRMVSGAHPDNTGSLHVLRKLGFENEQSGRRFFVSHDKELDIVHLDLTRERWQSRLG